MPQTTYLRITARAWQELTEAVNAANMGIAKIAYQQREYALHEPNEPLGKPIVPHPPLSWTDKLPTPFPTPAPSCDAPHCDCDTGEDCHANGAADPVQDSYGRLEAATMAEMRGRLSALRAEQRERHEVITAAVAGNVVTVRKGSRGRMFDIEMLWGLPDVSEPFAGVTEHARVIAACDAKLDGLKASVDALAERLEQKAGKRRENVRYVYPTSILLVSGQGLVWVISTQVAAHACGFEVGDHVARGDVAGDTMIVTGIASHGNGPLIGLTVRKAEG